MNERRREYPHIHRAIPNVTDRPHTVEWMMEGNSFYRFADANTYRIEHNNPCAIITETGIIVPHPTLEAHVTTHGAQTLGDGLMRTLHTNLSTMDAVQMPQTIDPDDFLDAAWSHFHMYGEGADMPIGYYQEETRTSYEDPSQVDKFLYETRERAIRYGFDPTQHRFEQSPVWQDGHIVGVDLGICYRRAHVRD